MGYKVKGSVTDINKAHTMTNKGVNAFPLVISESGVGGAIDTLLSDTDVLFIMIPPGLRRNTGANYALKMAHFLHEIEKSNIEKVVLISSTAVYDDSQGIVTEKSQPKPTLNAGKQLLEVEQLFFNSAAFKTTIVRFGGLFGGSRNPVRFLAGRKGLNNGNAPVNLIHRNDCIGILMQILKQDAFGHIFNAVIPEHPDKQTYYSEQAALLGLEAPEYTINEKEEFKQIDSVHLKEVLDYHFEVTLTSL